MATQLLGGNRAYYTPSFFGSGNAAFDPSGGVGTAAIGESDALRSIIAAMLQGFTPGPASSGMGSSMDTGGSDFTPPGGEVAAGGSGSIIQGRETLSNIAGLNQSLGMAAGIPGLESLGGISDALGSLSPILSAALAGTADAERQERSEISQRAWEALGGGLDISPIDYGSTGVNPAGAALAAFVPGAAALAGVNPIIGGLIGQGIRTAADPVPPTPQDVAGRVLDAIVPGIVNAGIQLATGSTVGQNIKGALTPVEDAIARTPEEVAREAVAGGRTAEGAAVETVVPTPVDVFQSQDDIATLQDAIAQDVSMQGEVINESPFATVQEMEEAFQQEMEAAAASTANPVVTTPTLDALDSLMGPSMEELMAGAAAADAAGIVRQDSATSGTGAPVETATPINVADIIAQDIFDAMVNYQQGMENQGVTSAAESEGDFGFAEAAADSYGYTD